MSKTRVFPGVTFALLSRMREDDGGEYALAVDPGRVGGIVHKPTPLGEVIVRFEHDDRRAEMTVTILRKPALLPAAVLWAGVSHALRRASDGGGDRR